MTPANAPSAAAPTSSNPPRNDCPCAAQFEIRLARSYQYAEFKKILDRGKHPAFIGKSTFGRNAVNGGGLMYYFQGQPIAVSLINPHYGILIAMNVLPEHRSHGLGAAIMKFLIPNFVRALDSRIPWFEKLGYRCVGAPKQGINLSTQLMVRSSLFNVTGKLKKVWPQFA